MTAPVSDTPGGFRRTIRREIRAKTGGIDVAADVNAVVAVNTGRSGRTTVSRSDRRTAISQPETTEQTPETTEQTGETT
jgi:hypothetical protein